MDLGLFHMPLHPADRPLVDVLAENTEKIIYADQLGFKETWIGEHYSASTEPITAPMMFLASLIPQTKQIRFGTGVICLPNHHPAQVAGQAAQFDHMTEGRFNMGIGPGGLASDMELFDVLDGTERAEKFAESIGMIKQIWSQDPPYDIKGKHWNIKITDNIIPKLGVGYMSKPFTKPHPPISLSSMSPDGNSVAHAVKQGWRPISANFAPESTIINHWHKYVEGCEAIGKKADGKDWSVVRNILIAESDAQAEDWLLDPKGSDFYYFDYLWEVLKVADYTAVIKPNPEMSDDEVTVESIVKSSVIYGSPKTVIDKIMSLRERSGPFGTLLKAAMDGSGHNRERERLTMRRLAEDVLPVINAG
ncbi:MULTISPECIES: LLM class flavin-dependent oxidoreductase [Roseobacteraceae]|jgi:alkanesulfonate monooxygenase SsuD/methylene tetrahydromethanopterin reductase-like flavin-dependent oxidoreductase (luciferase family)|uniref:Putative flavin monooxygenase n=1 Tax=Phaeobacter inhibens TaxID=221822 RepID=A0A2I7KG43_9RHOB|nr:MULTISPECIES: LLM class flavin-dependent oxidoreductase [Roseobacteraceae]AUR01570.1 putative flavin monooxygenase [Phaeobacter inhibens]MDF1804220.1 LLM class flavin-dependent oxidoreductase [Thalassovita sp.]UWS81617.1 LLM class flavin-dependent oxidoreductase [Phaeobacter sp. G2]